MERLDLLDESRLETIRAHAEQTYPNECCGMILRSGVKVCENAQDRLHALDPAAFPQDAQRAFAFEARDAIFLAESLDSDDPVLAIYHSHANGEPSFSKEDRAAILWNGQVAYPNLLHLVIDCRPGGVQGARLFGVHRGVVHELAYSHASGQGISQARRHGPDRLGPLAVCPERATH